MAQLLLRTGPFRELDRLSQQLFGNGTLALDVERSVVADLQAIGA
jgi:hypothetical protein